MVESGHRDGATGKPMRRFEMPASLGGKLWVWRYIVLRRLSQATVLLLFFGTVHWGWQIGGRPLLNGTLSSSELLGLIPMADPFAVIQILLTQVPSFWHHVAIELLLGAAVVLLFYGVIGGRVFCSWVCPINMVTDLAAWLRDRLGVPDAFHLNRRLRYGFLALALGLSALTGLAAFEWLSPIGIFYRELIYGFGLGWMAVLGLFTFDLVGVRHGWCGHLCPLGAFYALLGRTAQLRIRYDADGCTRCGECTRVCPEPQVLNLKSAATHGMVVSGECTNCGRCTPICPEQVLSFAWRPSIRFHHEDTRPQRRAA
jgi:ferredoxin-type protein NapH